MGGGGRGRGAGVCVCVDTDVTGDVDVVEFEGHWNEGPDIIMSRIRVSIGVLPTKRTKNNCSITDDDTVLSEGNLRRSLPKRVG